MSSSAIPSRIVSYFFRSPSSLSCVLDNIMSSWGHRAMRLPLIFIISCMAIHNTPSSSCVGAYPRTTVDKVSSMIWCCGACHCCCCSIVYYACEKKRARTALGFFSSGWPGRQIATLNELNPCWAEIMKIISTLRHHSMWYHTNQWWWIWDSAAQAPQIHHMYLDSPSSSSPLLSESRPSSSVGSFASTKYR